MSPAVKVAIKCAVFGAGTFLSSLASSAYGSSLDLGEVLLALSLGWGAALTYAGIGAVTPLEAIGKK